MNNGICEVWECAKLDSAAVISFSFRSSPTCPFLPQLFYLSIYSHSLSKITAREVSVPAV